MTGKSRQKETSLGLGLGYLLKGLESEPFYVVAGSACQPELCRLKIIVNGTAAKERRIVILFT